MSVVDFCTEFKVIEGIRRRVFQDEQAVDKDLDEDGLDAVCVQLIAYWDGEAVGTARVRFLDKETAKIERLAVLSEARGRGLGKMIMEKALDVARSKDLSQVVIHSQEYIKGLHKKLGFEEEGEVFEEAGIRHVKMVKNS